MFCLIPYRPFLKDQTNRLNQPLEPVSKLEHVSRNLLSLVLCFMLAASLGRMGYPNQGGEFLTPVGCSQQIAK